jgi:hypothetical protein
MKNLPQPYPGKLVEIIFGCRTPFEDIKMAANIAVSKNSDITISKMRTQRSEYHLGKETHGDNTKIPDLWRVNLKM